MSNMSTDPTFVIDAPKPQQKQSATTYFDWLFEQPVLNVQLKLVPAAIPVRAKPVREEIASC
jgi:hypothetical protein